MLESFPKVLKSNSSAQRCSDVKQNKSSGTQARAQIFINKYLDASCGRMVEDEEERKKWERRLYRKTNSKTYDSAVIIRYWR